jgi:hypothetical protein
VGDLSLINFGLLFSSVVVAVGMWATLLRCPHVHSDVALCVAELASRWCFAHIWQEKPRKIRNAELSIGQATCRSEF